MSGWSLVDIVKYLAKKFDKIEEDLKEIKEELKEIKEELKKIKNEK